MKFSEAFNETMFRFGLKGTDLAARSGLTETQISQFRNGKNLRVDSLEKILAALTSDQRDYLLGLVARTGQEDSVPLPKRGETLDPSQKAE